MAVVDMGSGVMGKGRKLEQRASSRMARCDEMEEEGCRQ